MSYTESVHLKSMVKKIFGLSMLGLGVVGRDRVVGVSTTLRSSGSAEKKTSLDWTSRVLADQDLKSVPKEKQFRFISARETRKYIGSDFDTIDPTCPVKISSNFQRKDRASVDLVVAYEIHDDPGANMCWREWLKLYCKIMGSNKKSKLTFLGEGKVNNAEIKRYICPNIQRTKLLDRKNDLKKYAKASEQISKTFSQNPDNLSKEQLKDKWLKWYKLNFIERSKVWQEVIRKSLKQGPGMMVLGISHAQDPHLNNLFQDYNVVKIIPKNLLYKDTNSPEKFRDNFYEFESTQFIMEGCFKNREYDKARQLLESYKHKKTWFYSILATTFYKMSAKRETGVKKKISHLSQALKLAKKSQTIQPYFFRGLNEMMLVLKELRAVAKKTDNGDHLKKIKRIVQSVGRLDEIVLRYNSLEPFQKIMKRSSNQYRQDKDVETLKQKETKKILNLVKAIDKKIERLKTEL